MIIGIDLGTTNSLASYFADEEPQIIPNRLKKNLTPSVVLSSFVLRALREDAEAFLGQPVEEAFISAPAYFNDARRKATKRAGELSGLRVERIISEPTAAAAAHGLYQKKENTKFLVFDLGGDTFDVSILELFHNILEVMPLPEIIFWEEKISPLSSCKCS